jgi:DNA repair protein RecO (recombination protein O)
MQWSDVSIILSTRKYGETSAVVRVLTRDRGVFSGVFRGAYSKNNRGMLQAGNVVSAAWNARLAEQLGTFKLELMEAHAAHIMHDGAKLSALSSACSLLEMALPERHPYPKLFADFHEFLHILNSGENWEEEYIKFELSLLSEAGFGLDLSECAATGVSENLIYVSPKSGRAVCADSGEPYKGKLLELPEFLAPMGTRKSPLPERGRAREGVISAKLTEYARELRTNQTKAEKIIWYHLRAHRFEGFSFRRQYPIDDIYIADFACLEKSLVIEIDGGQHTDQAEYDKARTEFLEAKGYEVLRFWNNEVMENIEEVLSIIREYLLSTPSLALPRKRERGYSCTQINEHLKQILAGMKLTGYFLEHSLLAPHNKKLPAARTRLYELMEKNATENHTT